MLHVRRSWRRKSSLFERMFFQGCFFSWEIILFQRNPLPGMLFHSRNHPFSEESSPRDAFQQKNASCFRGILSKGCFSTAECILFQRNPLTGIIFHSRNHPDSEESSPRDYFPQKNASCFRGILSQGLFSTAECILFQRNPLTGIIFHSRMHPVSEEFSPRDYFPQKNASCFRTILSQG